MKESDDDLFLTTNQDYGSFYFGRLQDGQRVKFDKIAYELVLNDHVRNERRRLPAIAYDIIFDKQNSLKITNHDKRTFKPIVTRRQLKYIKPDNKTNEERQIIIKNVLESYSTFINCIYQNKPEKNPQLSNTLLELVANELLLLNPDISADELTENMIAITVPHEYLGMPSKNPTKPYPGTEAECRKTPRLQNILNHFETTKKILDESKQRFDSHAINSQLLEGDRYIYNPFTNARPFRRI